MSALRPKLFAALLGCLITGAGAVPAMGQGGEITVAGTWEGRFVCAHGPAGLVLSIERGSGSQITASFRFYPLSEKQRMTDGEFEMAGQYDPVVGSFALKPTKWVKRPSGLVETVGIDGLLAPDGKSLRGRINGRGCGDVVLMRGTGATAGAGLQGAPAGRVRKGITSFKNARSTEDVCDVLLNWAAVRMKQEYPDLDPNHTPLNILGDKAVNLYRDKYFGPVFGVRFADMSFIYRQEVAIATSQCQKIPAIRAEFPLDTLLGRPFRSAQGSFSQAEILQKLQQIAVIETWAQRVVGALPTLPDSPEGFAKVQEYIVTGKKDLSILFPSEVVAFTATLQGRQVDMARTIVDEAVAEPIPGPASLEGARALAERKNKVQAYLRILKDEDRRAAEESINARVDAMLGTVIQGELQRAQAVPQTLDGLTAVGGHLRDFESRYAQFGTAVPVQAARAELATQRSALLASQKAAFAQEVKKDSGDLPGLKKLGGRFASIFPLRDDMSTDGYKDYAALLQPAREAWIDRQLAAAPPPAAKPSGSLLGNARFPRSGYREPDIVASIFIGDFAALQTKDIAYVSFYIRKMGEATNQVCPYVLSGDYTREDLTRRQREQPTLMQALEMLTRPQQTAHALINVAAIGRDAEYDFSILYQRHNCADEMRQFFNNATKYLRDPLHGVPDEKLAFGDLCLRRHSGGRAQAARVCACEALVVERVLTEKERLFVRRDYAKNLDVLKEIRPGIPERLSACSR